MKGLFKISMIAMLAGATLIACEEEKTELSIKNLVAENHDNGSKQIPRGGEILIEFDAIAGDEAKLDRYHIELHDHPASGLVADEYRIIDSTFANVATFKGLKNAHVHQHIDVPMDANLGDYHVVIVVIDEAGNSVDTEDGDTEIEVVQ